MTRRLRAPRLAPHIVPVLPLLLALARPAHAQWRDWMLGPFEKPRAANPVIVPDPAPTFRSPTTDSVVRWQEYATFNPAAVVRGGKVVVLAAEDNLVRGASGVAVQNFNRMFGFEETTGLV